MDDFEKIVNAILAQRVSLQLRRQFVDFKWTDEQMLELFTRVGQQIEPRFEIEPANRGTIVNLLRWLFNDPNAKCFDPTTGKPTAARLNKGIYLYGNTGVGKTLAISIIKHIAYTLGLKYELDGTRYSLQWQIVRTDEVTDKYAHGESLENYIRPTLIWFDDFGTEPNDVLYMGNRVNPMRQILEQRGDNPLKMTIITSNLPIDSKDVETKYGDRVKSRLVEMCNYYMMKGQDHRLCISPKKN